MHAVENMVENELHFLEIKHKSGSSRARICLSQGGRLDQLIILNKSILADFTSSSYGNNYASAILFPFVNRIKNGEYSFNNDEYSLKCNEVDRNNAIHGLVYDKLFFYDSSQLNEDSVSITLTYGQEEKLQGFPYKFKIILKYTLDKDSLSLKVTIQNKDDFEFPFTLGWHPYFKSSNIHESTLEFNSTTKFTVDEQLIINGEESFNEKMPLLCKDRNLDNAYNLCGHTLQFKTPEYILNLNTSSLNNFVQLYMPQHPNTIAIEPMTGVSNSFNNKIGLKTLKPREEFYMHWDISLDLNADDKITNTQKTKLCNS